MLILVVSILVSPKIMSEAIFKKNSTKIKLYSQISRSFKLKIKVEVYILDSKTVLSSC